MSGQKRQSILGREKLPPVLSLILLLELISLGATIPVVAYYARSLGGTAIHVTFCFFLTAAPKIFLQPIWGGLSDRIGRKPVMLIALAGSLASYAVWAAAPTLFWLLASRAVFGLFGSQLTLGSSIVADRLEPEERARGMGLLGATAGIGFVIGPALGGIVAHANGYAAVGWMNVALEGIAIALTVALLPETAPRRAVKRLKGPGALAVWRLAASHRTVGRILLVILIGTAGLSVIQGTLVVLAEDRWGYSVMQTGRLLSLFFLIGALVQGGGLRSLVPRFGELKLARAGHVMIAISLAALVPETPLLVLWISLFLLSVGLALVTPTLTALLSRATDESDQGRVQGLNQGVTGLGRSISGATMGGLYDRSGASLPFGLSSLLVLVAFLFLLLFRGDREERLFQVDGRSGGPAGDPEESV